VQGWTPLHQLSYGKHPPDIESKLLKLLLSAGANVDAKSTEVTWLHLLCIVFCKYHNTMHCFSNKVVSSPSFQFLLLSIVAYMFTRAAAICVASTLGGKL